jgi:hypothetical protein
MTYYYQYVERLYKHIYDEGLTSLHRFVLQTFGDKNSKGNIPN